MSKKNEKEDSFRKFLDCLMDACKNISENYFQLNVSQVDKHSKKIFRERIYCYELYHQLRTILEDKFKYRYTLHGEVDKRGHEIISKNYVPDFIVHSPGCMEKNLIVIEVKILKKNTKLKYDVDKIKYFINEANYFKGIMLLFGDSEKNTIENKIKLTKRYIVITKIKYY